MFLGDINTLLNHLMFHLIGGVPNSCYRRWFGPVHDYYYNTIYIKLGDISTISDKLINCEVDIL